MIEVINHPMVSLKSKVTQSLLQFFFLNKEEKVYLRSLARKLGLDYKNLANKLKEFEEMGLFKSEFQGNQKYYFLNKKFPLFNEYEQIFKKTIGIEHALREVLIEVDGLEKAYIFGSYARNNLDVESDIDLLLIGDHSSLEAQKAVLDLQDKLQREFNIVDMTEAEFFERQKKKDPFLKEIFSNPVTEL